MSLIARGLEEAGMATVLVTVMEPLTTFARPPRQVVRKLNIGATVGRPNDISGQMETLRRMVALIDEAEEFGAVGRDD